jgi:hypothetical protein
MWEKTRHRGFGAPVVRDPNLEEFLEEEMRRSFGIMGANECQHLREQLEEAKRNDPYALEQLIKRLLDLYVKLAVKIRQSKKLKKAQEKSKNNSEKRKKKTVTQ